jgi:hypothetical protein
LLEAIGGTHLKALILQHALDGGVLSGRRQLGLEDNTERAVSDDLALSVLHLFGLSGQAVLDLLTDYLC